MQFNIGHQEGDHAGGRFGWLTLEPAYKSAWVIDGQHRLFAYSGHPRASTGYLSVVAFENLPGHIQAKLFVDINHEQKSVKRSLLDELWAELHWDSSDPDKKVRAIISKSVQGLGDDQESPLYNRILLADGEKSEKTCISLSSVLGAIDKTGFYMTSSRRDIVTYGALWGGTSNIVTVKRTQKILSAWFREIAARSKGWWDLGSGEGGGLAMNDGVTVCINVLRSCFEHLERTGLRLVDLTDEELAKKTIVFAEILGDHFGTLSTAERANFRALRGGQGQSMGTRLCQEALHVSMPEFNPPGLQDFIQNKKSGTNEEGRKIIERIEQTVQKIVLQILKTEFGETEDAWWFSGVPKTVRKKVDERVNEMDGKSGGREHNFDLIHYREIAKQNWGLFEQLFGYGTGSKDRKTEWFVEVNGLRNVVMHPSKHQYISVDQVARLKEYDTWIQNTANGKREESPSDKDCDTTST